MITTKDIILVGAGVLAGHLLATYLRKNREEAQAMTGSTGSLEPTVDQTKLADCTKNVEEEIATTAFKTTANFDINAYKKEAIDRCLKGGAM